MRMDVKKILMIDLSVRIRFGGWRRQTRRKVIQNNRWWIFQYRCTKRGHHRDEGWWTSTIFSSSTERMGKANKSLWWRTRRRWYRRWYQDGLCGTIQAFVFDTFSYFAVDGRHSRVFPFPSSGRANGNHGWPRSLLWYEQATIPSIICSTKENGTTIWPEFDHGGASC